MQENATFETTLGALARPSGLARLQEHLERTGEPASLEDLGALQSFVTDTVEESPELDNVTVYANPTWNIGGGGYYPNKRAITVNDVTDLPRFAHEIGHAKGPKPHSLGRNVQVLSRELGWLTTLLGAGALGTALISRQLPGKIRDLALAKKYLGYGALASLGIHAPTLYEEARASLDAVKRLPDKAETAKELAGHFGTYATNAAIPVASFLAAKRLIK